MVGRLRTRSPPARQPPASEAWPSACGQRSAASAPAWRPALLAQHWSERRRGAARWPSPKYFSAWFCPFAHRATTALEHHRAAVPFEWEESLGWETRPPTGAEDHTADDRDDWYYYWKSPALLAANPLGMIPTLQDPKSGRAVSECSW